jgi:hypothetical protein
MSGESTGTDNHNHETTGRGRTKTVHVHRGGGSAVYFFGLIGSMVYYIQHSHGFWGGVLGILKAFVWPAFLVYDALKALAG